MIEKMGGPVHKRKVEGYSPDPREQLPAFERRERNVPREESIASPVKAEAPVSVPPITHAIEQPTSVPSVMPPESTEWSTGTKIAAGAGIGVGGTFIAAIAGQIAGMWGIHKVMNRIADAVAEPLVTGILALGKLNPFKKVWNWIVGGDGGSHSHDDHGHGGGHAHGHGHH